MMLAFVVLAACVRERSVGSRRLFGTVGLSLATASFSVIAADYFIQLRTVQTSLVLGAGRWSCDPFAVQPARRFHRA